jgi:hypothetical protein
MTTGRLLEINLPCKICRRRMNGSVLKNVGKNIRKVFLSKITVYSQ